MISRLNTSPTRTPVNASPTPSRTSTHDSGPSWVATPSMCGSFIRFSTPVYPGAQWVLSFPKRLRYFLHRAPGLVGRVLAVVLRVLETRLRECSPGAPAGARFGAVTFFQRFGSALNAHLHLHICVIDGVSSQGAAGELRFHPATVLSHSDVAAVQSLVRHRVLHLFERSGLLGPEVAENMREWRHAGGFSLDLSDNTFRVGRDDRGGEVSILQMPRGGSSIEFLH